MDGARLHKYYRPWYNNPLRWLIYRFLVTDARLRQWLHLGSHCGFVTFVTCLMLTIVVLYVRLSTAMIKPEEKDFQDMYTDAMKKIPRKKSVTGIRPAYNCIHKHLQQTGVFQEKTKKMLCKEHLELEILNSRINCINKLLRPEVTKESGAVTGRDKAEHEEVTRSCGASSKVDTEALHEKLETLPSV